MPNTVNQHLAAVAGSELRGFQYTKVATVAALPATGQAGEIVTVTATGDNWCWNAVDGAWRRLVQSDLLYPFLKSAGGAVNPDILADYLAGRLELGTVFEWAAHWESSDRGWGRGRVVAAGTGVADGGSYINAGTFQIEQIFYNEIDVAQFGPNTAATILSAFDAVVSYARTNAIPVIRVSPNALNGGIWDLENNWVLRLSNVTLIVERGATIRTTATTTFGGTVILSEGNAYGGDNNSQLTNVHVVNDGAIIAQGSDNSADPTGPGFDNALSFGRMNFGSYDGAGTLQGDRYALTLQVNVDNFRIKYANVTRARTAGIGVLGTANSAANFCSNIDIDNASIDNVGLPGSIDGKGIDIQHCTDVSVGRIKVSNVTGRGIDVRGTTTTHASRIIINGPVTVTESRQAGQFEFIDTLRGDLVHSIARAATSYGLVVKTCSDVIASAFIRGVTDTLPSLTLQDITGVAEFEATIVNHRHIGPIATVTNMPATGRLTVFTPADGATLANHPNALLLGAASAGTVRLAGSVAAGTGGLVHSSVTVISDQLLVDGQPWGNNGTTAARPTTSNIGQVYFDTTLNAPVWWNGTAWQGSAAVATSATVSVTGDGATTSFPVAHNLALASPFQPSAVTVLDPAGNLLSASSYQIGSLLTNQFTVTFSVAPANGAVHRFRVTA